MNIPDYLNFVANCVATAALQGNKVEVCRLLRLASETVLAAANSIEEAPMQTCAYPNCRAKSVWIPVIALPTLRTAGDSKAMVLTSRPTLLVFVSVCQEHRDTYKLTDWIQGGDWSAMRDVAHENGYHIPEADLIGVEFKPMGWEPGKEHLELTRGN